MYYWLQGFVLAIVSALFWPVLPSVHILLWLCIIFIALAALLYRLKSRTCISAYVKALALAHGILFGIIIFASHCLPTAYWAEYFSSDSSLDSSLENAARNAGAEHSIKGRVITLQPYAQGKINFTLRVHELNGEAIAWPFRPNIRLAWYRPQLALQQGDFIHAKVKFKALHASLNVGAFNYQRWMWSKNISARAYIKQVIEHESKPSLRAEYYHSLSRQFADESLSQGSAILALLFGHKGFSDEFWLSLRQLGLSHLFAISGLHIGLAAAFAYILALSFCRLLQVCIVAVRAETVDLKLLTKQARYQQWLLWWQRYFPLFFSFAVALCYAALAGFAIPTLRALLALTLLYTVRALDLAISRTQLLLLCIACVLFVSPLAILSYGFWLSLCAVVCILYTVWRFNWHGKKQRSWYQKLGYYLFALLRLQLLLLLLMLPLQILFFSGTSILAPLANLLAIPLFSFVIVPLLLLALLMHSLDIAYSVHCFDLVNKLLSALWQVLSYLPQQRAWFSLSENNLVFFAIVAAFCLLLLIPTERLHHRFKSVVLGLFVALLLTMALSNKTKGGGELNGASQPTWSATVLDVGQGLSVVVEQEQAFLLYDVGAKYKSGFSWARQVLLPYLQHRGLSSNVTERGFLAHLIISHSDNDHSGGLDAVINEYDIGQWVSGESELTGGRACTDATEQWGALTLRFFQGEQKLKNKHENNNNNSCVLLIHDGVNALLLPGDIEKQQEHKLVERYQKQLQAQVLIAPHHGSDTSSSQVFINAVKPQLTVFSAAYQNAWGFPAKAVVQRYKNSGVQQYNTAELGMIEIHFSDEIRVSSYRQDLAPFWYNQNHFWPARY